MNHPILEAIVAEYAGTPDMIIEKLRAYEARGVCDYIVLQLPTGDQSFADAKRVLGRFIADVMPSVS